MHPGFQGEPILHKTHVYCFTFQVGNIKLPIRICSQELADGMANLDMYLLSRNVLWGENWSGLQDVLSDGSICPYLPADDENVYFEASSTIPGLGTGGIRTIHVSPKQVSALHQK